jgi:hypothetical protein
MATAAYEPRARIAFDMNVPAEIRLDGDGMPTATAARDGSAEYRYFLSGHQIMWVPEAVHAAIDRAQAGDGACFSITKHRSPKPWTVIHLDADEPTAAQTPTPISQPRSIKPRPDPTPAPAPPCVLCHADATQQIGQRLYCDAHAPASQPAPAHKTEPSSGNATQQPYSTTLYTCTCAALRVAADVEKFAQAIARPLAFTTADIRAMAATLYIEMSKQGDR